MALTKETNFSNIVLRDAAGKALYTATTKDLVIGLNDATKVTLTEGTAGEGILKSYVLSQFGSQIGTIDIPKDLVVTSGSVVTAYKAADNSVSETTSEGAVEGSYLKLIIANQTAPVYIPLAELVDDYDATTVKLTEAIGEDGKEVYQAKGATVQAALADVASGVNANEAKIGDKASDDYVAATYYVEGDEIPEGKQVGDVKTAQVGTAASGLYKEIEDAVAKAAKNADDAIKELDVTDAAVDGQYVSAVSQTDGKITVTRKDLPTLSVKTGSEDYVAVDNHEVEIKTTTLADAVGMTVKYVKDGADDLTAAEYAALADKTGYAPVWSKADGTVAAASGLATATDVASEIVADEEVIAAALNDHETRIQALAADKNHNKTTFNEGTTVSTGQTGAVSMTKTGDASTGETYKFTCNLYYTVVEEETPTTQD